MSREDLALAGVLGTVNYAQDDKNRCFGRHDLIDKDLGQTAHNPLARAAGPATPSGFREVSQHLCSRADRAADPLCGGRIVLVNVVENRTEFALRRARYNECL